MEVDRRTFHVDGLPKPSCLTTRPFVHIHDTWKGSGSANQGFFFPPFQNQEEHDVLHTKWLAWGLGDTWVWAKKGYPQLEVNPRFLIRLAKQKHNFVLATKMATTPKKWLFSPSHGTQGVSSLQKGLNKLLAAFQVNQYARLSTFDFRLSAQ